MSLKSNFITANFQRVQNLFQKLTIRQKIVCGYALSLGIAILGTTGGLIIGDRYFKSARREMLLINEKSYLLSSLQGQILEIQLHQQEIFSIFSQQQALPSDLNTELREHLQELENLFAQLQRISQVNHDHKLENQVDILLTRYDTEIKLYFQEFTQLLIKLASLQATSENIETSRQLIWKFHQSQATQNFAQYSHLLTKLTQEIHELQQQNDLNYHQAKKIEALIIISSIVSSIIIASILALYTSSIITDPINAVTDIAQKVTKEENFELQAPITTQDEIGTLANSLNQLIQQVQQLLEIQRNEAESKLIQSEKMSSLGRMLAGVAHEINNPVNFISGNIIHAKNYVDDLLILLKTYQELIPNPPEKVQCVAEEIDLEFLETDLPKILNSMTIGTERTREIVRSLKNFSRLDEGEIHLVDLHPCIESTLLILNNRIKNKVLITRKYGDIPLVYGYMGLLYQVFMNIISNAIDALEEKTVTDPQHLPEITIITECKDDKWVLVRIIDNGSGISTENQAKIFETFFTTKPRGIGTGLGLAITHQIIVEKHCGKISCKSELNQGTEFMIYLPVKGEKK
ncbi:MAG: HAMP domain-containing protein [Nostocales cyanobacterium]|nr:MAG: HAMP domain-containing protein [Nostocales cyanobacterium]TAF15517.1 MAG: HAMP domain-containing protein [Nostocales cyanobacterium]